MTIIELHLNTDEFPSQYDLALEDLPFRETTNAWITAERLGVYKVGNRKSDARCIGHKPSARKQGK